MRKATITFGLLAISLSLSAQQTVYGDRTITGTLAAGVVNFASATSTSPHKVGTSLPATCSVGQTFFKSDATAGQNMYVCTSTNTWTTQGGSGSGNDLSAQTRMMWAPWGIPNTLNDVGPMLLSKRVYTIAVTHPMTATYTALALSIGVAATSTCGGGSDPCGLVFSLWSLDLTNKICQTDTLYGGARYDGEKHQHDGREVHGVRLWLRREWRGLHPTRWDLSALVWHRFHRAPNLRTRLYYYGHGHPVCRVYGHVVCGIPWLLGECRTHRRRLDAHVSVIALRGHQRHEPRDLYPAARRCLRQITCASFLPSSHSRCSPSTTESQSTRRLAQLRLAARSRFSACFSAARSAAGIIRSRASAEACPPRGRRTSNRRGLTGR